MQRRERGDSVVPGVVLHACVNVCSLVRVAVAVTERWPSEGEEAGLPCSKLDMHLWVLFILGRDSHAFPVRNTDRAEVMREKSKIEI